MHARFSVREAPGVTVGAPGPLPYGVDDVARRTAQRALSEAGRGYLGGHVELRAPQGLAPRDLRRATDRAVALAVAATLDGTPPTARIRVRT
ncbi:hypothetical protein [Streptomyces sp. NBC_00094]|uniref:hypothetical protein n=1 Tax=Streptomyces sp. NBC_00094 TaxID=2903620 RepID=UPI00225411EC|nr:hypothetical protein [Streptomyces sp. NBC_00094]MCX5394697.1 hypothetical protein [Streptomyces sp. NBC_00094]